MSCARMRRAWTYVLVAGLSMPSGALRAAEGPPTEKVASIVADVELDSQNVLAGQLVDESGRPLVAAEVELFFQGQSLARQTTDKQGMFRFAQLRGGTHTVRSPRGISTVRLWTQGAAPPQAGDQLLVIERRGTTRGQQAFREYWLNDGVIMAGILTAAVAIPVAVHNARGHKSGS